MLTKEVFGREVDPFQMFAALLLVPTGTTFAYAGFQIPGNLLSINKLPWIIIPAATTIFGVIYVWWHRRS